MSNFKSKYEENLKSGTLLIQKEFYNASVHCFYYACIQLMLHILYDKIGFSQKDIELEQKNSQTGFHSWIIKKFTNFLQGKEKREFNNFIQQLKSKRVEADYLENLISLKEIEITKNYANYVKELLTKTFEL